MALLLALVSAFVIGIGLVMARLRRDHQNAGNAGRSASCRAGSRSCRRRSTNRPTAKTLVKVSEAGPLPALERMISGTERGHVRSPAGSSSRA